MRQFECGVNQTNRATQYKFGISKVKADCENAEA
jgi:hypothetical protein